MNVVIVQIQSKSEGVAAAWSLIEAQKAEVAKQHDQLAEQARSLEAQSRYLRALHATFIPSHASPCKPLNAPGVKLSSICDLADCFECHVID